MAPPQIDRFRAGRVLSRSFGIWVRNFVPFTLLALLIQGPLIAFALLIPLEGEAEVGFYVLAVKTVPYALSLITAGSVAYGVFQHLRGTPASLVESLKAGMGRMLRVIAVATVVFLLIAGVLTATLVVVFVSLSRLPAVSVAAMLPAFLLMCVFFVAVPAAVVEGRGVIGSLRRSAFLTRDARMRIFGILFVIVLLGVAVELLGHIVASRIEVVPPVPLSPREAGPWELEKAHFDYFVAQLRWDTLVCLVGSAIVSGLSAVASVVAYYDLRSAKELVDLENIAKVFD